MNLADTLTAKTSSPRKGQSADVVGWCRFCDLPLQAGVLWIGDPMMSWAETKHGGGCTVRLPRANYRVSVEVVTFGKGYFTSRLRICEKGVRKPIAGQEIGEAGTDSGLIGVCDFVAMKEAYTATFGNDDDSAIEYLEKNTNGRFGTLRPNGMNGPKLPFVMSGLGDGMGPVCELRFDRKRIGIDAEFIPLGYKEP